MRLAKLSFAAFIVSILISTVTAHASDRPYLLTSSAAAEEDDDRVWAVESWWRRSKSQQGLSLATEYAFNPTTSVQLERSRIQDRVTGDKGHALEFEFKHLFNRIGRDGWGWGVSLSASAASVDEAGWRTQSWAIKLPYSLRLFESEAMLHINAGLQKRRAVL